MDEGFGERGTAAGGTEDAGRTAGTGGASPGKVPGPRECEGIPPESTGNGERSQAPTGPVPGHSSGLPPSDLTPPDLPPSDSDLVARVRGGDDTAYEELYRRHADAVRRYARTCCRDEYIAEDLTGEVFARTLQAIRGGNSPDTAVRAYLLTAVRRVAACWASTARREHLVDDFAVFAVSSSGSSAGDGTLDLGADVRAMHEAEQSLAVRAFRTLPERWQAVLWHTAVEDESPSEVAPLLGLTANATAVLAHRAREGLRQAYLQAHVNASLTTGGSCARYADRLGAHARGGLRARADRELRGHLEECAKCQAAAVELADLNAVMKALLPIAFIGWFAAAYTAKAAVTGAVVGGAAVSAGAGAAAAAASGSGAGGAGSGGASAEGLGAPVKAAIAAGVAVAAAGVALAVALTGGHGHVPAEAVKRPSAAPIGPGVPTPAPPSRKPAPGPAPVRDVPSAPSRVVAPPSTPAAGPAPDEASRKPLPTPSRTPKPTPTPTPSTPPAPSPTSPPVPPAEVYQVGDLGYGALGDGTDPAIRTGGWVLQRRGPGIGGTTYEQGVTVSTPSSVTIDLNRACTSYDALAGIDDLALGLGSARFAVYGDDALLWRSGTIRGGDPAVAVHVPIGGRSTIRLVVESGPGFPPIDVADWATSRISCG